MHIITFFAAETVGAAGAGEGGASAGFAFFFVLFVGLLFVVASTKFVTQGYAGVVERTGKYVKTVGPGVHFLMPLFSRLIRVNLKEQSDHYPPQVAITKDNMQVRVDAVLFFRVVDPKKTIYEVEDYKAQVEFLTIATLRNIIGGMTLSQCLSDREAINANLRTVVDEHTGRLGVKVTGLEINSLDPPQDFREAMELEKRSEIERNAAITRAEGQKIASISQAEGEKAAAIAKAEGEREALRARAEGERDAARLRAEGRAQAYASLFNAIKNAGVDGSVLSIRYLEALENVANGNATTLIMPSDSSSVLAAVAQMTQTMAATSAGAETIRPKTRETAPETIHPEEPFDPDLAPA